MNKAVELLQKMNALKETARDMITKIMTNDHLSDLDKDEQVEKIREECRNSVKALADQVDPILEKTAPAYLEQIHAITYPNQDLTDAITLIKAAGHNITEDMANAIVKRFEGQFEALKLIRSVADEANALFVIDAARRRMLDELQLGQLFSRISDTAFYQTVSDSPIDITDIAAKANALPDISDTIAG